MQECLDEIKREFKKSLNVDHEVLAKKILLLENALLKSFNAKLRHHLGPANFNFMSFKTRSLLRNITDLNILLMTLLNRSSVNFLIQYKAIMSQAD